MDHIFGDSDDISFGSTGTGGSSNIVSEPRHERTNAPAPRPAASRHPSQTSAGSHQPRDNFNPRPPASRPPRPVTPAEPAMIDTTPALSRLIAGMKSSFLPREEDMTSVRIITLSGHTSVDPLFLIRQDDTTILM